MGSCRYLNTPPPQKKATYSLVTLRNDSEAGGRGSPGRPVSCSFLVLLKSCGGERPPACRRRQTGCRLDGSGELAGEDRGREEVGKGPGGERGGASVLRIWGRAGGRDRQGLATSVPRSFHTYRAPAVTFSGPADTKASSPFHLSPTSLLLGSSSSSSAPLEGSDVITQDRQGL